MIQHHNLFNKYRLCRWKMPTSLIDFQEGACATRERAFQRGVLRRCWSTSELMNPAAYCDSNGVHRQLAGEHPERKPPKKKANSKLRQYRRRTLAENMAGGPPIPFIRMATCSEISAADEAVQTRAPQAAIKSVAVRQKQKSRKNRAPRQGPKQHHGKGRMSGKTKDELSGLDSAPESKRSLPKANIVVLLPPTSSKALQDSHSPTDSKISTNDIHQEAAVTFQRKQKPLYDKKPPKHEVQSFAGRRSDPKVSLTEHGESKSRGPVTSTILTENRNSLKAALVPPPISRYGGAPFPDRRCRNPRQQIEDLLRSMAPDHQSSPSGPRLRTRLRGECHEPVLYQASNIL